MFADADTYLFSRLLVAPIFDLQEAYPLIYWLEVAKPLEDSMLPPWPGLFHPHQHRRPVEEEQRSARGREQRHDRSWIIHTCGALCYFGCSGPLFFVPCSLFRLYTSPRSFSYLPCSFLFNILCNNIPYPLTHRDAPLRFTTIPESSLTAYRLLLSFTAWHSPVAAGPRTVPFSCLAQQVDPIGNI